MSMMLMVKAMQSKVGNPLRKLVLIKLADNANDLGECWPSHQHVADQCEISRTSVRNHIRALEKMGLLIVEHRKGPKGSTSNIYHLVLNGCQQVTRGVSADDTGGIAGDDTGISHSFESVNEPKTSLSPEGDDVRSINKCQQQDVIELWHKILPELPRVRVWNDARQKALRARWKEKDLEGNSGDTIEYWKDLFEYIRKCPWLMGKNPRDWKPTLDWVLKPANYAKIIEGNYQQ